MANNVVGSLIVNLGLETARLNSDTEKAAKHFNSFDKRATRSLNNIKRQASGLGSALTSLTGITGVLSVAGLGALAKSSIDSADKIGKLSTRIGASTEALSQYQHVAELSGVRFETLTMGWQRMTRRVAEAAQGTGEARGALEELNLSAQDLAQLRPEDQFEAIADALSGVGTDADRVRLAMKLFDSEGVSLIQTMTGGADGIRQMRQEADDLGLTLDKSATNSAASANDALTRLKGSSRALGLTMAKLLGPVISDIANWLSVNLPGAVDFAKKAFGTFRHFVIEGVQVVTNGLIKFYKLLGKLPGSLGETYRDAAKDLQLFNESLEQTQHYYALIVGKAEKFKTSADISDEKQNNYFDSGSSSSEKGVDQKAIDALTMQLQTEEEKLTESYFKRQEIIDLAEEQKLISEQESLNLSARLHADYERRLTQITGKGNKDREKLEQDLQNRIAGMRSNAVGLAVNLMRTLGQNSKKWALATIAIEKGLSIAMAVQNTAVAVTRAMTLGPPGMAMIPSIKSIGAIQVGLIAATGIAQAANVGSGAGGVTGSGITPVSTPEPIQSTQAEQQQQGASITIRIVGDGDFKDLVVKSIESAEANDEIRILKD